MVDDDFPQRQETADYLRNNGYSVREFEFGRLTTH